MTTARPFEGQGGSRLCAGRGTAGDRPKAPAWKATPARVIERLKRSVGREPQATAVSGLAYHTRRESTSLVGRHSSMNAACLAGLRPAPCRSVTAVPVARLRRESADAARDGFQGAWCTRRGTSSQRGALGSRSVLRTGHDSRAASARGDPGRLAQEGDGRAGPARSLGRSGAHRRRAANPKGLQGRAGRTAAAGGAFADAIQPLSDPGGTRLAAGTAFRPAAAPQEATTAAWRRHDHPTARRDAAGTRCGPAGACRSGMSDGDRAHATVSRERRGAALQPTDDAWPHYPRLLARIRLLQAEAERARQREAAAAIRWIKRDIDAVRSHRRGPRVSLNIERCNTSTVRGAPSRMNACPTGGVVLLGPLTLLRHVGFGDERARIAPVPPP